MEVISTNLTEDKEVYALAVNTAISKQLTILRSVEHLLDQLPTVKKEAIWQTCFALPAFSNYTKTSFKRTIESWAQNAMQCMSSIAIFYSSLLFLQTEGLLPELPPDLDIKTNKFLKGDLTAPNVFQPGQQLTVCNSCRQLLRSPHGSEIIRCPKCNTVNIIVKSKMVLVDAKTSIPMFTANMRSSSPNNKPPSLVQHQIINQQQKKPVTLPPKPAPNPHLVTKPPNKKKKEGGFIPLGPGSTILHPQSNNPGVRVTITPNASNATSTTLSGPPGSGFLPPFRIAVPSTNPTPSVPPILPVRSKEETDDHTFEGLPDINNIMDLETQQYLNV